MRGPSGSSLRRRLAGQTHAMRVLGIDLAWGEGSTERAANETGVLAVDCDGEILDAGWTVGLAATVEWVEQWAGTDDALAMVDAPLVVDNFTGQRTCERDAGRCYGRWKVAANSTNLGSPRLGGVVLRQTLEARGWRYDDGCSGPPRNGRVVSECYPYTTLVGATEFGYDIERPLYKRKPKGMSVFEFRPLRAAVCDVLIGRLVNLVSASPSLDVLSHPVTARLVSEPSPTKDREYKHREDLIDAAIAAWTGLLWLSHGLDRCQILGRADDEPHRHPTIIAPARDAQRVGARSQPG